MCATNVAAPCMRRGVSSIERLIAILLGEGFLRLSVSERSYSDPGRDDWRECTEDAEFERRCDALPPLGVICSCRTTRVDDPEPARRWFLGSGDAVRPT